MVFSFSLLICALCLIVDEALRVKNAEGWADNFVINCTLLPAAIISFVMALISM